MLCHSSQCYHCLFIQELVFVLKLNFYSFQKPILAGLMNQHFLLQMKVLVIKANLGRTDKPTFSITTESFSDQSQFRLIARRYFSTESQIRLTLDPKAITNKTFFFGGGGKGGHSTFFFGGGDAMFKEFGLHNCHRLIFVDLTEC